MEYFTKIKKFVVQHKRHIPAAALIAGFIFDFFTLTRVDQAYENIVLLVHLSIAGVSILVVNLIYARDMWPRVQAWLPVIIQFSFGALLSGFSIFYLRSATFSINVLFVLLFLVLLVLNEFLKERYAKLVFQLNIYYFVIFSYCIFAVPLVVRSVGFETFILSGVVSLVAFTVFAGVLYVVVPQGFKKEGKKIVTGTLLVYAIINILYVTDIIPPIPLALRDINQYHEVSRLDSGQYRARQEDRPWYDLNLRDVIRVTESQPVAVFSSVFSPARINTNVYHHWQYFDADTGEWVSADRIGFLLTGGRDEGFRGYTQKNSVFEGRWRVDVETERGKLIGRETFIIEIVDEPVVLEEVAL